MHDGNDSCRIFSSGLMLSHLEPRMSTMTVKPCLQTSSLEAGRRLEVIQREGTDDGKDDGEGGEKKGGRGGKSMR